VGACQAKKNKKSKKKFRAKCELKSFGMENVPLRLNVSRLQVLCQPKKENRLA